MASFQIATIYKDHATLRGYEKCGLKDATGIEILPPARKMIDLEGRLVKDAVRKVLKDRQNALTDLVHATM